MKAARAMALKLPEAAEQDHHGMPSFRVRGKIFATVPDDHHIRVMGAEEDIRAAIAEFPDACSPGMWGSRLACVVVELRAIDREVLWELLADAWRHKGPTSQM